MTSPRAVAGSFMHQVNVAAVLEVIRQDGPISRTEIASILNVSLPTVMRIVDELVKNHFVRNLGSVEPSGGRPRPLLEVDPHSRTVIGCDLSGRHMYGALVGLDGTILDEMTVPRADLKGEAAFDQLVNMIQQLMHSPNSARGMLSGIGIGAPGATQHREGVITWAPSLEWRDYPLRDRLENRFGLPIIVDTDVKLSTLGEHWYGHGRGVQNMVFITMAVGLGAGLLINGLLYRGHTETSGEIGYFLPGRDYLGRVYDRFGALESVASVDAIVTRCRQALGLDGAAALSLADVFDVYAAGDRRVQVIVDEAVDYLGMAVSVVGSLLDSELIVIGGSDLDGIGLLAERIRERVAGTMPAPVRIEVSSLGPRAAVLGAITSVLHKLLDYHVVQAVS